MATDDLIEIEINIKLGRDNKTAGVTIEEKNCHELAVHEDLPIADLTETVDYFILYVLRNWGIYITRKGD